jgi:hypothetical protein
MTLLVVEGSAMDSEDALDNQVQSWEGGINLLSPSLSTVKQSKECLKEGSMHSGLPVNLVLP